jgi:hypothetical protein
VTLDGNGNGNGNGRRLALPSAAEVREFVRCKVLQRQPLDDALDWVRFRIDTFPGSVSWLKPLKLEVQSATYHQLPWVGVRAGRRADSNTTRWEEIKSLVVQHDVRSALDIGANSGYFSFKLAECGVPTIAVEESTRGVRLGLYTRKRSGLEGTSFLAMEVKPENASTLPAADCVLVLSVWHHFVRAHGFEAATEMLADLWKKTGKLLVFETGEDEMPPSWGLPAMVPDSRSWLTEYLAETCAGASIVHLGQHDAFGPDEEPCRRNLFAAVRVSSENGQQQV